MNYEESNRAALFIGDQGSLPLETRRTMIQLLLGPFIDGRKNPTLWQAILGDEKTIRSHLGDLFLELIVDREQAIAFVRQIQSDDIEIPRLLRRMPLTFIDSVLLIYLRRMMLDASTRGERSVVSEEDMLDSLIPYERASNTDRSGFAKQCKASIEKMKANGILTYMRGDDNRYEISPVLAIIFSADEISALSAAYARLAGEGSTSGQTMEVMDEAEDEQNDVTISFDEDDGE